MSIMKNKLLFQTICVRIKILSVEELHKQSLVNYDYCTFQSNSILKYWTLKDLKKSQKDQFYHEKNKK